MLQSTTKIQANNGDMSPRFPCRLTKAPNDRKRKVTTLSSNDHTGMRRMTQTTSTTFALVDSSAIVDTVR